MFATASKSKASDSGSKAAANHIVQKKKESESDLQSKEIPQVQFKFSQNVLSGASGGSVPTASNTSNASVAIQTNLKVGKPNDRFEQEADQMADQVVSQPGTSVETQSTTDSAIQSKCNTCKKEETVQRQTVEETDHELQANWEQEYIQPKGYRANHIIYRKEDEEEASSVNSEDNSPEVQLKQVSGKDPPLAQVSRLINQSRGRAPPMDAQTRKSMERSFGADFSDVKIHTGREAQIMAGLLSAQAFVSGNDIYFDTNKYQPDTHQGKWLLAHELTHTLQQGASFTIRRSGVQSIADIIQGLLLEFQLSEEEFESTKDDSEARSEQHAADQIGPEEPKEGDVEDLEGAEEVEGELEGESEDVQSEGEGENTEGPLAKYLKENTQHVTENAEAKTAELAANEKTHDDSETKLEQSESAVVMPIEDLQSRSNTEQVDEVDREAPKEAPKAEDAKKDAAELSDDAMPSDIAGMNSFQSRGKGEVVGLKMLKGVKKQLKPTQETFGEATQVPPPKEVEAEPPAIPEVEAAPETPEMDLAADAIPPASDELVDFEHHKERTDAVQEEEAVYEDRLALVSTGRLVVFKEKRAAMREKVDTLPGETQETISQKQLEFHDSMLEKERTSREEIALTRQAELDGAALDQNTNKADQETKRKEVGTKINGFYDTAKTNIETKLNDFKTKDMKTFENDQKAASLVFQNSIRTKIHAWKEDRYSGAFGGVKWLKDKWMGAEDHEDVVAIFDNARETFVESINKLVDDLKTKADTLVSDCKTELETAKTNISEYVKSLPGDLKDIGEKHQEEMDSKLAALDDMVNSSQKSILSELEEKKDQAIQEADQFIEEEKEQLQGVTDDIADLAVDGAIEIFERVLSQLGFNVKPLMDFIGKVASVLGHIVEHPVDFISNMAAGVEQGLENFKTNFGEHMKTGAISWLTGAMSDVQVTLPKSFSDLKGMMNMGLELLGLTKDNIREKLVNRIGEEKVALIEKGMDIMIRVKEEGPIALWNMLKEKAEEIKQKLFDEVKSWIITNLVIGGIKKVLSYINPAGAFFDAVVSVYHAIMFVVDNKDRIVEFFQTILNAVSDIAYGRIGPLADKVERTLSMAIPMILDFLARQLGLGGIGKKIQETIQKVRQPIDDALQKGVNYIVDKAEKLYGKGKKVVKQGIEKGKEAIAGLLGLKKPFKDKDGNDHKLYFKASGDKAVLWLGSPDERPLTDWINGMENESDHPDVDQVELDKVSTKFERIKVLQSEIKNINEGKSASMTLEAAKQEVEEILKDLPDTINKSNILQSAIPGNLPLSNVTYSMIKAGDENVSDTVIADPLTKYPGNTKGSSPKGVALPGWNKVAKKMNKMPIIEGMLNENDLDRLRQNKEKEFLLTEVPGVDKKVWHWMYKKDKSKVFELKAISWHRTHLLNEELHGPGVDWNLVPSSPRLNMSMKSFDKKIKDYVKEGKIVRLKVKVYRHDNVAIFDAIKGKRIGDIKEMFFAKRIEMFLEVKDSSDDSYDIKEKKKSQEDPVPKIDVSLDNHKEIVIALMLEQAKEYDQAKNGDFYRYMRIDNFKTNYSATDDEIQGIYNVIGKKYNPGTDLVEVVMNLLSSSVDGVPYSVLFEKTNEIQSDAEKFKKSLQNLQSRKKIGSSKESNWDQRTIFLIKDEQQEPPNQKDFEVEYNNEVLSLLEKNSHTAAEIRGRLGATDDQVRIDALSNVLSILKREGRIVNNKTTRVWRITPKSPSELWPGIVAEIKKLKPGERTTLIEVLRVIDKDETVEPEDAPAIISLILENRSELNITTVSRKNESLFAYTFIKKHASQPKLKVGSPNDPLEHEADRMADQVVQQKANPGIQRKCSECAAEEKVQRSCATSNDQRLIQRKCEKCNHEEQIQRSVGAQNTKPKVNHRILAPPASVEKGISNSRSRGEKLPKQTLHQMNESFGADFGQVRVHQNSEAESMNKSMNANAFTVGKHVYFGANQYRPGTSDGDHLLAHELTHTIQQGAVGERIQREENDEPEMLSREAFGQEYPSLSANVADIYQSYHSLYDFAGTISRPSNYSEARFTGLALGIASSNDWARRRTRVIEATDNYSSKNVVLWLEAVQSAARKLLRKVDLEIRFNGDSKEEAIFQKEFASSNLLPLLDASLTHEFLNQGRVELVENKKERDEAREAAHNRSKADKAYDAVLHFVEKYPVEDGHTSEYVTYGSLLGQLLTEEVYISSLDKHGFGLDNTEVLEVFGRLKSENQTAYEMAMYKGHTMEYFLEYESMSGFSEFRAEGEGFFSGLSRGYKEAMNTTEAAPFEEWGTADYSMFYFNYMIGVPTGVGLGLKDMIMDIVSLFTPEFWSMLYSMATDEAFRYDMGVAMGHMLVKEIRELQSPKPADLGWKVGKLVGRIAFEVVMSIIGANLVKVLGSIAKYPRIAAVIEQIASSKVGRFVTASAEIVMALVEQIKKRLRDLLAKFPALTSNAAMSRAIAEVEEELAQAGRLMDAGNIEQAHAITRGADSKLSEIEKSVGSAQPAGHRPPEADLPVSQGNRSNRPPETSISDMPQRNQVQNTSNRPPENSLLDDTTVQRPDRSVTTSTNHGETSSRGLQPTAGRKPHKPAQGGTAVIDGTSQPHMNGPGNRPVELDSPKMESDIPQNSTLPVKDPLAEPDADIMGPQPTANMPAKQTDGGVLENAKILDEDTVSQPSRNPAGNLAAQQAGKSTRKDRKCGDPDLPYTKIHFSPLPGTKGVRMTANPLTRCADPSYTPSTPKGGNWPYGWDCVKAAKQSNKWVRAHLLHGPTSSSPLNHLNGPGRVRENIIISDKSINGQMRNKVERNAISRVLMDQTLSYSVEIKHFTGSYPNPFFAKEVDMRWKEIDPRSGATRFEPSPVPTIKSKNDGTPEGMPPSCSLTNPLDSETGHDVG